MTKTGEPATLRDGVTLFVTVLCAVAGIVAAIALDDWKLAVYGLAAAFLALCTTAIKRPKRGQDDPCPTCGLLADGSKPTGEVKW